MDDLILEFVGETTESLAVLDQELVRFEQNPNDKDILGNIFRVMHTIKGTCGFLGLPRLERIAHAGEDVLGRFRDGTLAASAESVTLILRCLDQIRFLLNELATNGQEGDGDDSALIGALRAMAEGQPAPAAEVPASAPAPAADGVVLSPEGFPVAAELLAEFDAVTTAAAAPAENKAPHQPAAPAVSEPPVPTAEVVPLPTPRAPAPAAPPAPAAASAAPAAEREKATLVQSIRVNVDVLENLMTMVSEMVLTRNELLQLVRGTDDSVFKEPIQRLSRVTSELQEGVMKTRMQPIGNAWGKLPRIVRDLSNELGKKIALEMHGEETELDRQVLELIQDPLTHMVRNSADHGLERPADRLAAGKAEVGTIRLSAHHEGGHIIIQIVDDGRGLNTDKIKAKIVERGLATQAELDGMEENQIHQFIMRPGFSTADQVTKVSGRGVGMDVVRSNIEKIGGTIEFSSTYGHGSQFTIKIPLTLAIIAALIVQSGRERFAIPQIAVSEVVRIAEGSEHRIETLKGAPVLRLRNRLLPLIHLRELLKLQAREPTKVQEEFVVVCRNGSQVMGIIVDAIADSEEVVVKPMSPIIPNTRFFSGNTILGDGRVILILDTNGLASTLKGDAAATARAEEQAAEARAATQSILLFRTASEGIKAVPLSKVHRIENFDMSTAESVQGEVVVQYRDRLLSIISPEGAHGVRRDGRQTVLVFGEAERSVGMAIDEIIDIVDDNLELERVGRSPGVSGSSVVAGKAVDVIAPEYFLEQAAADGHPRLYGAAA